MDAFGNKLFKVDSKTLSGQAIGVFFSYIYDRSSF